MGVPVVTSRVAAGGVDARAPDDFLAATTPDEYVAAIMAIIEDPALRRSLAAQGRARMLSHHAWDGSMRRLDRIIFEVVRRCAPGRTAASCRGPSTSSRPSAESHDSSGSAKAIDV